jgi:hypothetical protein
LTKCLEDAKDLYHGTLPGKDPAKIQTKGVTMEEDLVLDGVSERTAA